MTLEIRQVDTGDEAELRAWWEIGRDATAERPVHGWPVWEISRAALPIRRSDGKLLLLGAYDGGRMVGAGMMFTFTEDNDHLAEIDVYVAPQDRRRGVGRALLGELERRARADRRTSLIASVYPPVGADSAGSLFAEALGYPVASAEETKVVDLATAPAGWAGLDDEVAAVMGDHRVEVFDQRVPDEMVDDFCVLLSALLGEIPTGDLDLQQQRWTPQRLQESWERFDRIGLEQVVAVAVAPDGHLCGFSDLRVNRNDPRHASVGATMVQPGHRGHRLGLGMKLLTHRRLLERYPDCEYVETGNAGVNAAMSSVNTKLGYRVVERCLDVQKRL